VSSESKARRYSILYGTTLNYGDSSSLNTHTGANRTDTERTISNKPSTEDEEDTMIETKVQQYSNANNKGGLLGVME